MDQPAVDDRLVVDCADPAPSIREGLTFRRRIFEALRARDIEKSLAHDDAMLGVLQRHLLDIDPARCDRAPKLPEVGWNVELVAGLDRLLARSPKRERDDRKQPFHPNPAPASPGAKRTRRLSTSAAVRLTTACW